MGDGVVLLPAGWFMNRWKAVPATAGAAVDMIIKRKEGRCGSDGENEKCKKLNKNGWGGMTGFFCLQYKLTGKKSDWRGAVGGR